MTKKIKICNFKPSAFGGYSFILVSLRKMDETYFFNADVMHVDDDGKFTSGAVLTYSPHKTLEDAMLRWVDLGPATIEGEDTNWELLIEQAIQELSINKWWVN